MSRQATAQPAAIRLICSALFLAAAYLPAACVAENLAVTFDDLPLNGALAPGMTPAGIVAKVLPILQKHRVPQVFGFINAKRIGTADGAAALQAWVDGGQRVGNHGYSHLDLSAVPAATFLADLQRNEAVLDKLSPTKDWHWFRYPYLHEGERLEKRHAVRTALRESGYRIAQVTIDWEDYLWNSAYARCVAKHDSAALAWLRSSYLAAASAYIDADRKMAELVFGRTINHVLLLHLGAFSAEILPELFPLLQQQGFTLVTLEEAQKDPAYQSDPDGALHKGGSLLEQWMDVRRLQYPSVAPKPYKELEAICK